jgi:hypothetical protein
LLKFLLSRWLIKPPHPPATPGSLSYLTATSLSTNAIDFECLERDSLIYLWL